MLHWLLFHYSSFERSYFPWPAGKWLLCGDEVHWGSDSFSETDYFLETWLFVWFVSTLLLSTRHGQEELLSLALPSSHNYHCLPGTHQVREVHPGGILWFLAILCLLSTLSFYFLPCGSAQFQLHLSIFTWISKSIDYLHPPTPPEFHWGCNFCVVLVKLLWFLESRRWEI